MRADGRQPTQGDIEKIAGIYRGATKALYLGFVSLEAGLPLSKAQAAVNELLATGVVRKLTARELDDIDAPPGAEVYLAVR